MNLEKMKKMSLWDIGQLSINERKTVIEYLQSVTIRQNHPPVFGAAIEAKDLSEVKRLMDENKVHKLTPTVLKKYLTTTDFDIKDIPFIKFITPIIELDKDKAGFIIDNVMLSMAKSVNPNFSQEIYKYLPKQYTAYVEKAYKNDQFKYSFQDIPLDNLLLNYEFQLTIDDFKQIIKSNNVPFLNYLLKDNRYVHFFNNQEHVTEMVRQTILSSYDNSKMLKILVKNVSFDKDINLYLVPDGDKTHRSIGNSSSQHLGYILNTFNYDIEFINNLAPNIINAPDRGIWQVVMTTLSKQPLDMIKEFLDIVNPIKHRPFHEHFAPLKKIYELQNTLPKSTLKKTGNKI